MDTTSASSVSELDLKPRKGSFLYPRIVSSLVVSILLATIVSVALHLFEYSVWFGLIVFLSGMSLGVFSALVAYRKERYQILTSRLVCHRGGLFNDEATEFEVRKITHVKLKLPWLRYRLFKVGNVIVETAGTSKPMVMRAIRDPEAIYAEMRKRMQSNGYDLTQTELLHEESPALIGVIGECIGLFFGATFLMIFFFGEMLLDSGVSVERSAISAGIGLILLGVLTAVVLRFLDLRRRKYRVFNDVVVYEEGFLTRENAFIPYENLADSNTKRTLIDQIFGLYDVHISCQGSNSEIKFRRLKNGEHLSATIDRLVTSAEKKPDPSKPSTSTDADITKPKRQRKSELAAILSEDAMTAEYRIHALRLLIPQMLLLPLFPIWILAMLKSLILLSSTRYFVRPGSLRHSYKFLRVDDREFSYDKITGVVIKRNLWDQWLGTMSLKFWSIGSGKSLEFSHVHCGQVNLPTLMRQVGIPPASAEAHIIDADFKLGTWLRSHLLAATMLIILTAAIAVSALLAAEEAIYFFLLLPLIFSIVALIRAQLYYPRQSLSFHEHHIEAKQGIVAKRHYCVRYKNVKRITTTRYPGGSEGSLKIYVAGEEAYANQARSKSGNQRMKQCAFTSGMLADIASTGAFLDDILSGRADPCSPATKPEPTEILAESPRSTGNAVAALLLTSVVLFPLIALLPISLPITIVRVKRWRYRIEDFRIVLCHGVIFRHETSILLDRVDSLQQSQGVLNKIFRNGKVSIMTAGSSKPDLVLIDSPEYRKLHDVIRENSSED